MDQDSARKAVANYAKSLGVEVGLDMNGPLDVPVRPLGIMLPPRVASVDTDGVQTALLYGDSHFPHQDDATLAIVAQVAKMLQPTFVVHMGDLIDAYPLSRFDKNPQRKYSLQTEINMARQHLAHMRITSPNSRFLLLGGNHEDRLRRTLWNLEGTANALSELTNFQQALTWPALLGLEELGIEFVGYTEEQAKKKFLPKMLLKHGTIIRKFSGYTARGEMEKYGKSGASGHTHRLAVHFHQDHNGNHVWVETGCTCLLTQEYIQDPDWQNGFVVITFDASTGAPAVEPVYVHNGLAVWRGYVLSSPAVPRM